MTADGKRLKEYFIGTKLGQGSYASVHKTRYNDRFGSSIIACKIFDKRKVPHDVLTKFFPRELDILRKLNNPHVIHLQSIVEAENKVFIFMTFAERGDLYHYLKNNGRTSEKRAKQWFREMVDAVIYLHSNDIAHRDLKCENILLTKDNHILVTDFGFARYCLSTKELSSTYCGSAMYAAPEIISGIPYNPKISDIWSLGIILFVMLNGRFPFDDGSMSRLLQHQLARKIAKSTSYEMLSESCKNLILEILEPNTKTRITLNQMLKHSWMAEKKKYRIKL